MEDAETRSVLFEFLDYFKPHKRFHLGDAFNFDCLRTRASKQEKRKSFDPDVEAGCAFIKEFKPDVFLDGNHEFRLRNLSLSDDGKLVTLANETIAKINKSLGKARVLPYDCDLGVFRYGDTNLMHGYYCGPNAARQMATAYGKSVMAHVHASAEQRVERHDRAVGYTIGCIAKTSMPYDLTRPSSMRHNNGWGYGIKLANGTVIFNHARKHGGRWMIPTDFREFRGE